MKKTTKQLHLSKEKLTVQNKKYTVEYSMEKRPTLRYPNTVEFNEKRRHVTHCCSNQCNAQFYA